MTPKQRVTEIKRALKRDHRNQSYLADQAGYSRMYVSQILRGVVTPKFKLDVLDQFEKVLGIK